MIDQLKLIGLVLDLIVGVWLLAHLFYLTRVYTQPIVKALLLNCLSVNILIAVVFFWKFRELNLPYPYFTGIKELMSDVGFCAVYLVLVGISYSMLWILVSFRHQLMPRWVKVVSIAVSATLTVGFLLKGIFGSEGGLQAIFDLFVGNFGVVFLAVEPIVLIVLLLPSKSWGKTGEGRLRRTFALLYLSRYAIVVIGALLLSELLRAFVIMLYLNIIPFIWIDRFFRPHFDRMEIGDKRQILDALAPYNISPREREIIELVLAGKTNREIGDALFISVRTVKNHLYSIFKKLNIKSRYQLIHLEKDTGPPKSAP